MKTSSKIVAFLVFSISLLLTLTYIRRPSTDRALQARFLAHRADFENLAAMATKDSHLVRIAPDFTWLDNDVAWPRANTGLSPARWNDYRRAFSQVSSNNGIIRRENPTRIFISIVSTGLVPSGSDKGFVYSLTPLTPLLHSLDGSLPTNLWDGPYRDHFLAYKQIQEHWYIYYEDWD